MLTAAALHRLVGGWPEGARPEMLRFTGTEWVSIDGGVLDAHAVMLHEASAARWLEEHDPRWKRWGTIAGHPALFFRDGGDKTSFKSGDTRIDALSAAVLGVGKKGEQ